MADIRDKILKEYGLDIQETDLIGLYKVPSPNISEKDLEGLLSKRRKNWNSFLNSPREDKVRDAKKHLSLADVYETILRNKELREQLFAYRGQNDASDEFTQFARTFFQIISSSRKIDDEDVSFFFSFYQGKVKNKRAVIEMLEEEFGLTKTDSKKLNKEGREEKDSEEDKKKAEKGKKSHIMVTLFNGSTLKDIQKCENWLEKARISPKVIEAFPEITQSLSQVLHLDSLEDLEQFKAFIKEQREKAANCRYDGGQEFSPVVDIFNTMGELAEQRDVSCNFREFSLLVRYSRLNPYMYEILAPKEKTLRDLYEMASQYYQFNGIYDFIVSYFIPLYRNFGIYENGVKRMMKKAKRSGGQGEETSVFSSVFGKNREEKMPVFLEILCFLSNLPLYLSFLVYELVKNIVWKLRYITYLALVPILPIGTMMLFRELGLVSTAFERGENLLAYSASAIIGGFGQAAGDGALSLLILCGILLIACGIPAAIFVYSLWQAATKMRKKLDWLGIEKTYQMVIGQRRKLFSSRHKKAGSKAVTGWIIAAILNIICVGAVGYGLKGPVSRLGEVPAAMVLMAEQLAYEDEDETEEEEDEREEESGPEETEGYKTAVVIVNAANVRSGPGQDYGIVTAFWENDSIVLTGNSQTFEGGSVWYEIFLDENQNSTGWISGSLIEIQ